MDYQPLVHFLVKHTSSDKELTHKVATLQRSYDRMSKAVNLPDTVDKVTGVLRKILS